MRLPAETFGSRDWRIEPITTGFHLEDVWALPTHGGAGDFPRLVDIVTAYEPQRSGNRIVAGLFAVRLWVGALLGWDDAPAESASTLADRLPRDLRGSASPLSSPAFPFRPLYSTPTEWAAELANRTVHGVVHLGWVPDGDGYRGELAILVKPNGLLGRAYLLAIRPFRYLVVYPAMLRELERRWNAATATPSR